MSSHDAARTITAAVSMICAAVALLACGTDEGLPAAPLAGTGAGSGSDSSDAGAGSDAGDGGEPTTPAANDDTDVAVFAQDRVLGIELTLPPGGWEALIDNALAEEYTSASLRIDGVDVGTVGLRFKGSYSLTSCFDAAGNLTCEKLSMKLKFDEYEEDKRFHGLKRLHLNSVHGDPSLVKERLAYGLFRDMGITSPRTGHAVVTVNGVSQGLYTVVEDVDGRFTDSRFSPGDGNLYKEAWPQTDSASYFADRLETNEETATHEGFQAFARDMLAASDAELVATLGRHTDLDYFARYMAVDYGIANWDGITTFYCGSWGCGNHNYYMYQEPGEARFRIIPWDMNATFSSTHWLGAQPPWDDLAADCATLVPTEGGDLSTRPASCDPTIRALALDRELYQAKVRELLDNYFIVERLEAQIAEAVAVLEPAVAVDPFLAPSEWQGSLSWLRSEIAALRVRLEQVGGSPPS